MTGTRSAAACLRTAVVLSGLAVLACSTRGESPLPGGLPGLPRVALPRGNAPADPVYTGTADEVYRTCFDAVLAEFDTAPRIVKPERGLLVFSEDGAQTNTSLVVTTVGENAAAVHIETRGRDGVLGGRETSAIRGRLIRALDARLARAERVAPRASAPRGTSALAEKQDALERIRGGLGFAVVPSYLIDLEAKDLQHLAHAVEQRIALREVADTERHRSTAIAMSLGKELHDLGRYEEARDALEHAVALEPQSAPAHCNLGEIYKHLRDFDVAIHHLEEAKRLDPLYPESFINLGIVYDDFVIDDAQALAHYRKYLELGGTDPRVADWIRALEEAS